MEFSIKNSIFTQMSPILLILQSTYMYIMIEYYNVYYF